MTLQQHFNLIKEGKGNKIQFVKQARELFPQYFNQYTNYDNAISTLKSKQIISEAAGGVVSKGFNIYDWKSILAEDAKAVEKEISKEAAEANRNAFQPSDMKNADNINFNEIMKGFYAEMKDPENAKKSGDELKAIVVKNLAKDPLYYTKNGMFGEKGVGYTDEAPGLGTNTQPKSKNASILGSRDEVNSDSEIVKNSLVGTTKKNVQNTLSDSEAKTNMPKKVKEMPDKGVSGVEKKMKLQEALTDKEKEELEYIEDELRSNVQSDSAVNPTLYKRYKELKAKLQEGNLGHNEEWSLEPEGRFWILTYSTIDGKKEKTFNSEDEAKKWIRQNLSEQTLRSLIRNIIKEELDGGFNKWREDLYNLIMKKARLKRHELAIDDEEIKKYYDEKLTPEEVYNNKWLEDAGNFYRINEELGENYETKKDLAQLQKDAASIEPKAKKLAQTLKGKSAAEVGKFLKDKGITDSDLITRVIDLAAKK